MNFLVDFARFVDKEDVVAVHIVFDYEVNQAKGCDERTGDTEHHSHAE